MVRFFPTFNFFYYDKDPSDVGEVPGLILYKDYNLNRTVFEEEFTFKNVKDFLKREADKTIMELSEKLVSTVF